MKRSAAGELSTKFRKNPELPEFRRFAENRNCEKSSGKIRNLRKLTDFPRCRTEGKVPENSGTSGFWQIFKLS
jgi:hypothetical protein